MLIYLNKLPVCSGECVTDIKIVYQGKMKNFFTHLAKHAPMKDLFRRVQCMHTSNPSYKNSINKSINFISQSSLQVERKKNYRECQNHEDYEQFFQCCRSND
jgi:hypothetical protein